MTVTVDADLDLCGPEAAEWEAHWEAAIRDQLAMDLRVAPSGPGDGSGGFRSRHVGDLLLADWDCPPMEGVRSSRTWRDAQLDVVAILAGYEGEERLSFGGTDAVLENGTLAVVTGRAGDRFVVPHRVRKRILVLPRAALEAAGCGSEIPSCLLLEQARPLVPLFRSFLDQMWRHVPGMNASDFETARAALIALTAGAIRTEWCSVTDKSALPALRAQLDKWIVRNLDTGLIRVEDLAAAHNVSTRTIHRAFAVTGDTMTSVVRARRLSAVREDVVRTNLTIAAIAHRWGYYDPSHLGREFRRFFGVSPSEYRQAYGC